MAKRILVAVDGSEHSQTALEFACDLADKYGGELHLVHVVQHPPGEHVMVLGAASVTFQSTPEQLHEAGRKVIEASEEIAKKHGCKLESTDVEGGDPVKQILAASEKLEADMIVMGSRGLGNLAGALMGSVSDRVTHLSKCTCVTVR